MVYKEMEDLCGPDHIFVVSCQLLTWVTAWVPLLYNHPSIFVGDRFLLFLQIHETMHSSNSKISQSQKVTIPPSILQMTYLFAPITASGVSELSEKVKRKQGRG